MAQCAPAVGQHVQNPAPVVLTIRERFQPNETNSVPLFLPELLPWVKPLLSKLVMTESRSKNRNFMASTDELFPQVIASGRRPVRSFRIMIKNPDVHSFLSRQYRNRITYKDWQKTVNHKVQCWQVIRKQPSHGWD